MSNNYSDLTNKYIDVLQNKNILNENNLSTNSDKSNGNLMKNKIIKNRNDRSVEINDKFTNKKSNI